MTKTPNKGASADRMAAMRAARAAKKVAEHKPAEAATAPVQPAPEPVAEAAVEAAEAAPVAPVTATTMEKAAITEEAKRHAKIVALRAAKLSNADPVGEAVVVVRDRSMLHAELARLLVEDLRAHDVGREQVRRELDTLE